MGTLYLVRHGQASFGAEDYDVLSPLGHKQALRLGEYFKNRDITFDAALTGTLQRQISTFAGICEGMNVEMPQPYIAACSDGPPLTSSAPSRLTPAAPNLLEQVWTGTRSEASGERRPARSSAVHAVTSVGAYTTWAGLNEYDSHAVIATVHAGKLERPESPEQYRHHFRLLKDGLKQWMDGVVSPHGMPSYSDFVLGVTGALDHVRKTCEGNVLLVSSGGPISTAVGHILGCSPEATIELNLRIRNASVTEFAFTPKRHMLVTYNTLPHLDPPEYRDWVTYA